MTHSNTLHQEISGDYALAINQSQANAPRIKHAEKLGYDAETLTAIPAEAAGSSFGCGNPLALSGIKEGDTVVDLGSGAGLDVILAAKKVGPDGHVIGVDMTAEMIETAQANIAKAGLTNAEIRKGFIEKLPLEDNSVDWIISNCVLNLSPDKPAVFAEIFRVLKPGGQVVVSDIVAEDLPAEIRASAALHSACLSGAISWSAYQDGLQQAGLTQVAVLDRLDYSAEQMHAMVFTGSAPGTRRFVANLPEETREETLNAILRSLEGKVASIKFQAQKTG